MVVVTMSDCCDEVSWFMPVDAARLHHSHRIGWLLMFREKEPNELKGRVGALE
jgi:hypothetical protein